MSSNRTIVLLRLSYWVAAIADFSISVLILIPARMGALELEYPMGLASAVVFCWGMMLLVADRRPLERRWILVPTAIVIAILTSVRTAFALKGAVPWSTGIFLFGIALTALVSYSYYNARKVARSSLGEHERA